MSLEGHHPPVWTEFTQRRQYPPLDGHLDTDVLVMGGGIAGVTAAALLHQAGKRVALIEMNRIAGGTTGHSTAHLDTSTDADFQSLLSKWGKDPTRRYVRAKAQAIDLIEHHDRVYGLDAAFQRVTGWVYAEPDHDLDTFQKELDAVGELGFDYPDDMPDLPFKVAKAMRLPNQGRVDPLAYTVRLAERLADRGVGVFEKTTVQEAADDENGRVKVTTDRGTVTADAAVLMGHAPVEGTGVVDSRVRPYQSYVIGVRVEDDLPDELFFDWDSPYHYTRRIGRGDSRQLIIGGADHATGAEVDAMRKFLDLEAYARKRYKVHEVTHRWSHEFWEPADGMPFIGRAPGKQNVYFATGFNGEGITFGTVAAMLLTDLVLGRPNDLADLFSPTRGKLLAQATRLVHASADAVKGLVADRARPSAGSIEDIRAGEGAVVKVGGEQLAVFRDESGEVHALSPVCRHMGCIVHWNNAEKTWDCPCHGGRYDALGHVIMGPPRSDLPAQELPVSQA